MKAIEEVVNSNYTNTHELKNHPCLLDGSDIGLPFMDHYRLEGLLKRGYKC
jgi:hypothetical protein